MKKKRRTPEQRRKRMRRKARLADARQRLTTQQGTDVIGAYERWYGVDRLCAIVELRQLGVPISEEYEAEVRNSFVQRAKLRAAERAARRAANKPATNKRATTTSGPPVDLYGDADLIAWSWNRSDPDEVSVFGDASLDASWDDANLDAGWDDARLDAGWDAGAEVAPESFGGYGPRPIEYNLLEDLHILDLTVIEKVETKIERRDEAIVRVRITLEEDPEVLAKCAWSLIFAIGAFSFSDAFDDPDADVYADADDDVDGDVDEWTAGDMLRCLSFDRGRLYFHADHVRGRCMQTTIDIDHEGKITLETVDRGNAATRWIAKLQDKRARAMDKNGKGDRSLDPLPF